MNLLKVRCDFLIGNVELNQICLLVCAESISLIKDNKHRLSVLESQKKRLKQTKEEKLMRLIKKIRKRLISKESPKKIVSEIESNKNEDLQNKDKDDTKISTEFLEAKGYSRFGNFLISNVVHDFVFLIEEYCTELEEAIRSLDPEVLMLYLTVLSLNRREPLTSEMASPSFDFLWVYLKGDTLVSEYDQSLIEGNAFIIIN